MRKALETNMIIKQHCQKLIFLKTFRRSYLGGESNSHRNGIVDVVPDVIKSSRDLNLCPIKLKDFQSFELR